MWAIPFSLLFVLLLTTPPAQLAEAAPLCPGSNTESLPSSSPTPPATKDLRTLLLIARTVRDVPDRRTVGEGALSRAGSILRRLLTNHPKDATLHALAGERDLLLVQYRGFPEGMSYGKKAERQNDLALKLNPKNPEARLSKGIELYFKPWFVGGSVSAALHEFETANTLRPGDPRILSWIGLSRHRLNLRGGRAYLNMAERLCPESSLYLSRATTFNPRAVHP